MSAAELHIVYEPDEDGTGKIVATAKTGAFAAQGEAWFGRNLESFLEQLRAYPLSSQTPPTIDGGYWDGKGVLVQCLIRISIKPYDLRGRLLVHAELASDARRGTDGLHNCASIRFLTEYALVERFATELAQVLNGKREAAILIGTTS